MNAHHKDNVNSLFQLFSRLARLDWRKQTRWDIKASEVRLLLTIQEASLSEREGVTVSGISQMLRVTSPTVTQMINSLIDCDCVYRSVHPDDRRITEIILTDKGKRIAQEAKERADVIFQGLVDHLGEEESAQLIDLLDRSFTYFEHMKKQRE